MALQHGDHNNIWWLPWRYCNEKNTQSADSMRWTKKHVNSYDMVNESMLSTMSIKMYQMIRGSKAYKLTMGLVLKIKFCSDANEYTD